MKRSDIKRQRAGALWLLIAEIAALMIPNIMLAFTELWSGWSVAAGMLIVGGLYLLANTITRRVGLTVVCMLPLTALCAFQIVLLYLYGESIIAADMFVNMETTNPDEAGELLNNLYPALLTVVLIYGSLLLAALLQLRRRSCISRTVRRRLVRLGAVMSALGALLLIPASRASDQCVIADEIFPFNVLCNIGYAVVSNQRMLRYESTSQPFSYNTGRRPDDGGRQIYVYIIGEASRAASWALYGYERQTNPQLSRRSDLCIFRNVITQSNTTHKSVPMLLSPVHTARHGDLYRCKGLATLFREAGFRTCFLSNQSPQGAMVDKLAGEADEVVYIGAPRQDMQLLRMMRRIIETDRDSNLLIILHCYGSHFSYHQRYPREYALFQPDNDVAIKPQNAAMIVNAYDNSILYTDHFLNAAIECLDRLGEPSALLFCADHGEDLFDDHRGRFLHASPTITYYQLHIPCFAWFSDEYRRRNPERVKAARSHCWSPATTRSMFHTVADMAQLESPFIDRSASLVSTCFDELAPRYYLDDHNRAVPFDRRIGITERDSYMFRIHGIALGEQAEKAAQAQRNSLFLP